MMGMATVMTFPDAPPLGYLESQSQYSEDTVDDPALVTRCRKAYDLPRAAALSPKASLALMEKAAEDDRNGEHRD